MKLTVLMVLCYQCTHTYTYYILSTALCPSLHRPVVALLSLVVPGSALKSFPDNRVHLKKMKRAAV